MKIRWLSLLLYVYLVNALNSTDLCAEWLRLSAVRCGPEQDCTGQTTSYLTTRNFVFVKAGGYRSTISVATGNGACGLGSTVVIKIDTFGDYSLEGNNTNSGIGMNWTKIKYTPKKFWVALAKDNKDIFYTPAKTGPCMDPADYLSNQTLGCPCNGTYSTAVYNSATQSFDGYREIIRSDCPNGTCPENFYMRDNPSYGNIRYMEFGTNKYINLTATSEDEATGYGYGDANVSYNFQASLTGTCPNETTTAGPPATPPSSSTSISALVCVFVLLLLLPNAF